MRRSTISVSTFSVAIGICSLLIVSSVVQQRAARAQDGLQPTYEPEIYDQAAKILNPSLGGIDKCYRSRKGFFDDDIVAQAFDTLLKKAAEPDGLCNLYLAHKLPIEFEGDRIPLGSGVYVNIKTVCEYIQFKRCPK